MTRSSVSMRAALIAALEALLPIHLNLHPRVLDQLHAGRVALGLWEDGFHPQAIWSSEVFQQKLDYLHANPRRKGLVQRPELWWYSSAAFYAGEKACCMEVDYLDL